MVVRPLHPLQAFDPRGSGKTRDFRAMWRGLTRPRPRLENRGFSDPCGAKSRGGGGAPPTTLILLRNQFEATERPGTARAIPAVRGPRTRPQAGLGWVEAGVGVGGGGGWTAAFGRAYR